MNSVFNCVEISPNFAFHSALTWMSISQMCQSARYDLRFQFNALIQRSEKGAGLGRQNLTIFTHRLFLGSSRRITHTVKNAANNARREPISVCQAKMK